MDSRYQLLSGSLETKAGFAKAAKNSKKELHFILKIRPLTDYDKRTVRL